MEIISETVDDLLQELSLNNQGHDVNKYSRKFYASLLSISDDNDDKAVMNIINMVTTSILLVDTTKCNTHINHNISKNENARIVLYNALKYVNYSNVNISTLNDLHSLLLSKINIHQTETRHVLMGLQSLYKEKFKIELYANVMIIMRKLFYSPLQEIQVVAERVIVTVISGLSDDIVKAELTKFVDTINWDSHNYFIVAKLIDKYSGAIQQHFYKVAAKQVFKGLHSNYSSHSASVLFTALINKCDFEVFKQQIFPVLHEYLEEKNVCSRTLSCSIIKYVLPICSDKYRLDFYETCIHLPNINFSYLLSLISYNYLKFSVPKTTYVMNVVKTCTKIDDELNFQIAFSILCRYNKLNAIVSDLEFAYIKSFLKETKNYESSFIKNFQYFVSHLSVTLNDLHEPQHERYLEFFAWLYLLCLVKLSENCEEKTKIFGNIFYTILHILTGSSQELKLGYNLPKNKHFNAFENPIYLALMKRSKFYFISDFTAHKFLTEFINRDYYVSVISKVISNYLLVKIDQSEITNLENNLDSLLFTSNCYAGNRSLYCIDVILEYYSKNEIKCKELFKKMFSLIHFQFTHIKNGDMRRKFESFPLFIVMQCILNVIPCVDLEHGVYLSLFTEIQEVISYILENLGGKENKTLFLESKSSKAVEHSIIICIDIMCALLINVKFSQVYYKNMLEILEKVITDSNMKRPVSHAAVKLEQLLHETPQYKELYLSFYEKQESCFKSNSKRNTKIRRNPGTRLILHTLIRGIENQNFLNNAMHFLINSSHSDSPDFVAAALHTLESLISDSNFKSKMVVYIPELLSLALKNLDCFDFAVKNASMQLFQAITTRLLGQKSEEGKRPLSAVEIFLVYPEIRKIMLDKLFTRNSGEDISKIAVLSFLSESDYSKCMHCETHTLDFHKIKSLFHQPDIARFAVQAYVATCSSNEIFNTIITDVKLLSKDSLLTNEKFYRICAIEQLYKRFLLYYPDSKNINIVNKAVTCNSFPIDTKLFKIPPSSITQALNVYNEDSLIFILNNVPPFKFCKCLSICFKQNFSQLFLHKCLDSIIEKSKIAKYQSFLSDLIVVLINFLMTLSKPNMSLIVSFYKVIMLLLDLQSNFQHSLDQLVELKNCISERDIYTQHIWLVVYSYKSKLTYEERDNVSKIISACVRISEIGKPDELYHISVMLKDLFALLTNKDKINFLYLLIVLAIQVEETCELDEFFLHLIGKNLSLRECVKWLLTTGNSIFLTDSHVFRLFTSKLFKFISSYKLSEWKYDSFYSKSDLFTEKLSFIVYVLSLLCKLCNLL